MGGPGVAQLWAPGVRHRHTLLACAILTVAAVVAWGACSPVLAASWGYLSHLLIDAVTEGKVPLLAPFYWKRVVAPWYARAVYQSTLSDTAP